MNDAFFDEMHKIADAVQQVKQPPEEVREHPVFTAAKGIGSLALGAGVGYAGAHGIDQVVKRIRKDGKGIPPQVIGYAAPVLGAAAGFGANYLQHRMMQRMKYNMNPPEEVPHDVAEDSPDGS